MIMRRDWQPADESPLQRAGAMRRSSEPGGRPEWGGFAARGRGRARLSEAGEPEYSLPFLPMPPQSGPASIADGSTLRLRGLPYSASVEDITEFFAGRPLCCQCAGQSCSLAVHIAGVPAFDGWMIPRLAVGDMCAHRYALTQLCRCICRLQRSCGFGANNDAAGAGWAAAGHRHGVRPVPRRGRSRGSTSRPAPQVHGLALHRVPAHVAARSWPACRAAATAGDAATPRYTRLPPCICSPSCRMPSTLHLEKAWHAKLLLDYVEES